MKAHKRDLTQQIALVGMKGLSFGWGTIQNDKIATWVNYEGGGMDKITQVLRPWERISTFKRDN